MNIHSLAVAQHGKAQIRTVDQEGRIREVNEAYCHMSGYGEDELIQMRIGQLDCVEDPEDTRDRVKQVMTFGGDLFETVHRRKDGSRWDVEVSISYSPVEGGCFFAFFRDISERNWATNLTNYVTSFPA